VQIRLNSKVSHFVSIFHCPLVLKFTECSVGTSIFVLDYDYTNNKGTFLIGLPDVPINRDCPDYGSEVPCPERMSRGRLFVQIFHFFHFHLLK
jgi:hypothetical protein